MGKGPANTLILIEAKTIQKLRARILPFFSFYTSRRAFLDWINIGFAALTMNKEPVAASQPHHSGASRKVLLVPNLS